MLQGEKNLLRQTAELPESPGSVFPKSHLSQVIPTSLKPGIHKVFGSFTGKGTVSRKPASK